MLRTTLATPQMTSAVAQWDTQMMHRGKCSNKVSSCHKLTHKIKTFKAREVTKICRDLKSARLNGRPRDA